MRLPRKDEIELAPVLLRRRALRGPVGRVIELVGHLRRPEAADVAVEDVALDRLAEAGGAAVRVGFPPRGEHERATEWEMRRHLRHALQCDDVLLLFRDVLDNASRLAVDRFQM